MTKKDESAFPITAFDVKGNITTYYQEFKGLTKREYFAGLAMQGAMANPDFSASKGNQIAYECVVVADALIAELNKPQS